ncbi:MAG: HDOD domain-containing protein [Thiobacillaceae bacterium]
MSDPNHDQFILKAVLAGGVKIPAMPRVLLDLAELDGQGDASPREYARVIGRDPGLAGAIFRVVGSPVFGLRAKADSLEKAVTLLGLRTTHAVASGETLRSVLTEPALQKVMDKLWQRVNAVAETMLATLKATRMRGVSQDQAMLLGLFHDCGVAVACRRYPDYASAFAQAPGWPDLAALDRNQQTDHAVIGQMVARSWQLPQDIALAIRHHHAPRLTGLPEPVTGLITLLQFAMHLVNRRSGADDGEWPQWQANVIGRLVKNESGLADLEAELA